MKRSLTVLACLLAPLVMGANQYNANTPITISSLLTYTTNRQILFIATKMPVIPGCPGHYFVIPGDGDDSARSQAYSRLLTAYSTREVVNIGYDGVNCGPEGYIMVYRVG